MKLKLSITVLAAQCLLGCATAKLVEKTYEPSKAGIVKYEDGFGSEKRRQQAEEIMNQYCAPEPYVLTKEQLASEKDGYVANTSKVGTSSVTTVSASEEEYVYLHFRCGKRR